MASAYRELGQFSTPLREAANGKTRLLASTPANANFDDYQEVGTSFVSDPELGCAPGAGLKVTVGANNLLGVYPEELPRYIRDQQFALSSTAFVSRYPSSSPVGINGGSRSITKLHGRKGCACKAGVLR